MAASQVSGDRGSARMAGGDENAREEGDVRLSYYATERLLANNRRSLGSRTTTPTSSTSPFLRELLRRQWPSMGEVNLSRSGFVTSQDAAEDEGYVSLEEMTAAFEHAAGGNAAAAAAGDDDNSGNRGPRREEWTVVAPGARAVLDSTVAAASVSDRFGAAAADVLRENARRNDDATNGRNGANNDSDLPAPLSLQDRARIHRVYFVSYSFPSVPATSLHRAYPNLRHVDIRDNAALECVGGIVRQLPQLESLNVCDCPNLKSLLPLAEAVAAPDGNSDGDGDGDGVGQGRRLSIKHLWVRGCDLSSQTPLEWEAIFLALSTSSGPVERLALSRNNMPFLPSSVSLLSESLTYLFAEDCPGMILPDELGGMSNMRYLSLAGCDLIRLPPSLGRLPVGCDVNLNRNPGLVYPPPARARSVADMKLFFHEERMKLLRGMVRFYPSARRARMRANERLYRPGGRGYEAVKERFEAGQEAERRGRAAAEEEAMGGRTHRLSYLESGESEDDKEDDCEHGRKRTRRRSTVRLA